MNLREKVALLIPQDCEECEDFSKCEPFPKDPCLLQLKVADQIIPLVAEEILGEIEKYFGEWIGDGRAWRVHVRDKEWQVLKAKYIKGETDDR